MPHWYVSEILFVLHPSGAKFVMNTIGIKFLTNEAKKLAKFFIGISKKVLKTWLRFQYNAAVFPFYFLYGGLNYVYKQFCVSDCEDTPALEPTNEEIIGAVKNIRKTMVSSMNGLSSPRRHAKPNPVDLNVSVSEDQQNECLYTGQSFYIHNFDEKECAAKGNFYRNSSTACLGVNHFSGSDLMWDIPIITAKAKYFSQYSKEGKRHETMAAKRALEEHSMNISMPKTREEYNKMAKKARQELEYVVMSHVENFKEGAELECNSANNTTASYYFNKIKGEREEFNCNSALRRHSARHETKTYCNSLLTPQNKMWREISTINKTLRKIQMTCSKLLQGLSNLNEILSKVISMKEKLSTLEFQVDEGKRLLLEVESDRFVMKSKLTALERLINEEEKFLRGDVSYESGFYESEISETAGEY